MPCCQPICFKELCHQKGPLKEIVALGDHILATRLNRSLLLKDIKILIGVKT